MKHLIPAFALSIMISINGVAQTTDKLWVKTKEANIRITGARQIVPNKYITYGLTSEEFKDKLFSAPNEKTTNIYQSSCIISLPMPDGSFQRFRVIESSIMEEALALAFPNIKTFSIRGIDDAYASGKLDWTEFGFHGMVLSPNGDYFIDPYCVGNITDYISYYTTDFVKPASQVIPEVGLINSNESEGQKKPFPSTGKTNASKSAAPAVCVGAQLRSYRLAVSCTGEYAVAATGLPAPTVAQTLAKIVISVNRVDGVYEKEVSIRLILVANQTSIIFIDSSTDPFTGNMSASTLINESQTVIAGGIGSPNYDIGHTFSTGAGGLANLGCVCTGADKARGITGNLSPVGDPYDIDYVAHEVGHQFGGNHTFNCGTGSCANNRHGSTSMEPGSGVTIMGYAGICGASDNIENHSIPYFHAVSYDEIVNFTNSGAGNSCAVISSTGNQPPVVTGSGDFIVPKSTPFYLTGSAIDPDGDALTLSWEEMDAGSSVASWNTGAKPYFRSYAPVTTGTRYFPITSVATNGNFTTVRGEYLPTTAQTLKFRLTARDNKMGGGGVCYASNNVVIAASGPLTVTYPSAPLITWPVNTQQTVTWDVNGTTTAPVSCDSVRVLISYNGGAAYSVLLNSTPNDGSELITVPTLTATINTCRIKVESIGNQFYDVGNSNFTISTEVGLTKSSQSNAVGLSVWPNPFNNEINFSVSNLNSHASTEITMIDLLGKTIMQTVYTNKNELKESINVSDLSKGVYFIKVINNNKQSVYRIVKD